MDHFEATLTAVAGSVRNDFTVLSSGDHAVNEGALERPNTVHALGRHQFGVDVLVAPAGSDRNDVIVTGGATVEVVHEVHFLVEFRVADIEG